MAILKLKASALIEVIISLLLISITFATVMTVVLNIRRAHSLKEKVIALSILNNEIDSIKNKESPLIDSRKQVNNLYVELQYMPYPGFENLVSCRITISSGLVKLIDHKLLISL